MVVQHVGSHQRRPSGASRVPRRPAAAAVPAGSSPASPTMQEPPPVPQREGHFFGSSACGLSPAAPFGRVAGATPACGRRGPCGIKPGIAHHRSEPPVGTQPGALWVRVSRSAGWRKRCSCARHDVGVAGCSPRLATPCSCLYSPRHPPADALPPILRVSSGTLPPDSM